MPSSRRRSPRLAAAMVAALLAGAASTASAYAVHELKYTSSISHLGLSLKNTSGSPAVEKRKLEVVGNLPSLHVTGSLACESGWAAKAVEVRFGKVVNNGGHLITLVDHGKASVNFAGANQLREFDLQVPLQVQRTASFNAVNFNLSPADVFEHDMKQAVDKGGSSAAEYLRQTNAFDMPETLSLTGWCRKGDGTEVPKVVLRDINITVIYDGDPNIMERAKTTPAAPPRQIQKPAEEKHSNITLKRG